ncbi:putative phospholipid:diacylglycerol acyltransferase 2 [Senna tora]|uniref:Putative phospholipid:diacylglycerol acyltransferase 2 n=1 Tax=Senna tora TaxID=362788 RepID=A0A834TLF4_9FABA|nr:putative phospholipid:diacylglycerol acyltransferase 2 [Senna tora]
MGGGGGESPGVRLKREGLTALHPVVLVPGIVNGGLQLWEGRPCAHGFFRKTLWGSGASFAEILTRPLCWLEHLSLHNETGLDPPGIRVRAVPGLLSGSFAWNILIENLARIGYEGKNLHMAAYDWRLSFQNTEIRDQSLSRLKSQIELMFVTNGFKKVVVVPHSMGALYFLHFLKWVETPSPMGGGGGGPRWCDKHIKAIMNIGPAFLGVPKAASNLFSAESKEVSFVRAMAFRYLGLRTLEHVMRVCRTWDSIISTMPKGGETIWGDLDWCPEEKRNCDHFVSDNGDCNSSGGSSKKGFQFKEGRPSKYGRIISFGKAASELPCSLLGTLDSKEILSVTNSATFNSSCGELWTKHEEMSSKSIKKIAEKKAYTATTVSDLLRSVAPKTMNRAEAQFSHGIAENLDDPKYTHHKYWSNPLETKLPEAPNMEIYCLYGVGIPTERSYVYKLSSSEKFRSIIPLEIDNSTADDGEEEEEEEDDDDEGRSCLRGGVYFVDGDHESVPLVSAGFMCAKGWRGTTRFNPSGVSAFVREFRHKQQPSMFHGVRDMESTGAHINVMGNFGLVEDVLRVAAGATGAEIGGDRIFSDIIRMSEKIHLRL